MTSEIQFIHKGGQVKQVTFSKGATISLNPVAGHNFEIVSYHIAVVCDSTVVTRSLSLAGYDGASGAGNVLLKPFSSGFAASDNKTFGGGLTAAGGAYNSATDWHEWIIPSGGSLAAAESAFVAGDTWTIRILYRDIPTDLMQ